MNWLISMGLRRVVSSERFMCGPRTWFGGALGHNKRLAHPATKIKGLGPDTVHGRLVLSIDIWAAHAAATDLFWAMGSP
jgi:hypothetical protein